MTKKGKKITNKYDRKIYFFGALTFILVFVTGVLLFKEHNLETTSANSDYICVKAAENSACNAIEGTCSPWENGIRRCNGIQYTMVAYHSVRTSCASGYSQYYIGETGGNTGRQQEDYNLTSDIVLPRSYVWECTARPEGYNYLCSENTESGFNSFIGSIKSMKYAKNYSDCNFLNRFVTVTCEYTQATVKHGEKTCEVIQEDTVSPNWDGLGSVVNP